MVRRLRGAPPRDPGSPLAVAALNCVTLFKILALVAPILYSSIHKVVERSLVSKPWGSAWDIYNFGSSRGRMSTVSG